MHTKGPLTAEYSNVYRVTESKDGEVDTWIMVADCISGIHLSYEEAKANAVLFAAAPELLEELEACLHAMKFGDPARSRLDAIKSAREAIHKAKGE